MRVISVRTKAVKYKTILIIIVLTLSTFTHTEARVGMGEINFNTPGGHVICDCDPYPETPVLVGFESSIKNLQEWYFYKNHIVGYGKGYYFIFNEVTGDLQYFKNKDTWEQAITNQNIKPFFTRWLNISDSIEALYAIIFLGMFIWIPLILIIAIGIFIYFHVTGFNKRKLIVAGFLLFIIAIVILYHVNIHSF